jgi:hypothetical protein
MPRAYRSIDEARRAFDQYAALEPKLTPLWELCRLAAPPSRSHAEGEVEDEEADEVDPFAIDVFAADNPDDGWCAEDFFSERVKSKLLLLVGTYRSSEPTELQSAKVYDAVYELLLDWALARPCLCCADAGNRQRPRGDDHRIGQQ